MTDLDLAQQIARTCALEAAEKPSEDTRWMKPVRHYLAPRLREQLGREPALTPEEWEDVAELFQDEHEEHGMQAYSREREAVPADVQVLVWVGGKGFARGPWHRTPSSVVALYFCEYLRATVHQAGESKRVVVDIDDEARAPFFVSCEEDREQEGLWMMQVKVALHQFMVEGWRSFPELVGGGGVVPS